MGDAPDKGSKVDWNFILFLLQWAVNFGCLMASFAANRSHTPGIGIPAALGLIVFSIAWNARSIRPNGCIFAFPYLLSVVGINLFTLIRDLIHRR